MEEKVERDGEKWKGKQKVRRVKSKKSANAHQVSGEMR